MNDCENKADEDACPSSCDLENDDTCGWYNSPDNNMNWIVWAGRTPSKGTGPPYDHTKGNKNGMYRITMEYSLSITLLSLCVDGHIIFTCQSNTQCK